MMLTNAAIVATIIGLVSGHGQQIVDLTHVMNEQSPKWPLYDLAFTMTLDLNLTLEGGFAYSNNLLFSEHTGTHIDAPMHFHDPEAEEPQWYTHQIPPERCVGQLHVLHLSDKAEENPDYEVTPQDVLDYEDQYGKKVESGSIVLLDFDWAKKVDDERQYFGTQTPKDTDTLHFPGFGLDVVKLLYDRGVVGVGTQCASDDSGQAKTFPVHKYLLSRNIWMLENVGDLSGLPRGGGKDTVLTVGFMKTEMGTGGPARLLALVNDDGEDKSAALRGSITSVAVILLAATANMIV